MPRIGLDGFHEKSCIFQHAAPLARPVFTDVRFIVVRIQQIHALVDEIIFRHAAVINHHAAGRSKDSPDLLKRQSNIRKMMGRSAARHELESAIGEWQPVHISSPKHDIGHATLCLQILRLTKHLHRDVDSHDGRHVRCESECRVARTRGDIKRSPVLLRAREFHNSGEHLRIRVSRALRVKRRPLPENTSRFFLR